MKATDTSFILTYNCFMSSTKSKNKKHIALMVLSISSFDKHEILTTILTFVIWVVLATIMVRDTFKKKTKLIVEYI